MGLVAAIHAFAFEYAMRALVTAPGSLPASMPTAAPALVEGVGQPPAQQHDPAEAHVEAVPPR